MEQFPSEFIARLHRQFPDAEKFIAGLQRDPVWSVRLHPQRDRHDLALGEPVPWCQGGYYLAEKPRYTLNPLFHCGNFYPQEASSMFLWHVLKQVEPLLPDNPVALDLCAAPGGKSTLMASFLDGRGLLVSNEVIRSRAWILRENMIKWGYANIMVTNNDPADFKKLPGMFDLLVLDAPCSGEGMFRKDASAMQEWSVQNAALCAQRQRRIIMDAWDCLREDGILVYSTCTFNPAENEENLMWLQQQAGVEFLPLEHEAAWGIHRVDFDKGCGYAFYPHQTLGEGFFVAVLQKKEASGKIKIKPPKKEKAKVAMDYPSHLVDSAFDGRVLTHQQQLVLVPTAIYALVQLMGSVLNVFHQGVLLGEPGRKEFMPSPELPLSLHCASGAFPEVEVTLADALQYLKGGWSGDVPAANGWHVVRYRESNLGLIKVIGARVNNYYPKEWRIRMNIDEYIS